MNTVAAGIEMPKYRSHKEVWALKIRGIGPSGPHGAIIIPEDSAYSAFRVDPSYMEKHQPTVGGYYVMYADGYQSFSPAAAFETGYTRIGDNAVATEASDKKTTLPPGVADCAGTPTPTPQQPIYSNDVSNEPLDLIRANEVNDDSLRAKRFRRLFNEIALLQNVLDQPLRAPHPHRLKGQGVKGVIKLMYARDLHFAEQPAAGNTVYYAVEKAFIAGMEAAAERCFEEAESADEFARLGRNLNRVTPIIPHGAVERLEGIRDSMRLMGKTIRFFSKDKGWRDATLREAMDAKRADKA